MAALGKVDILISGGGSNMRALVEASGPSEAGGGGYTVRRILADRPCGGLDWAANQGYETVLVDWSAYPDRGSFSAAVAQAIRQGGEPDVIACAGFMRILDAAYFDGIQAPTLNIHPSLLPAFKGIHAQRQAWQAGVRVAGATVHFMIPDLDAGPIIQQAQVPCYPADTEQDLQQRILQQEHRIYPQALAWVVQGQVRLSGDQCRVEWPDPTVYRLAPGVE